MDARNLNVLFVGLGSIGTRHLQNLTTIAKKRGYGLQIDGPGFSGVLVVEFA